MGRADGLASDRLGAGRALSGARRPARRFGGRRRERRDASTSPVEVLNLFAYTGLATLAMAGWGAAVTHVDAARPSVAWARENAAANGLTERPIRWIVEDARAYVRREVRRGRRYAGIVLDPPSYGHAGGGSAWQLETDLPGLLDGCAELLEDDGFVFADGAHRRLLPRPTGQGPHGLPRRPAGWAPRSVARSSSSPRAARASSWAPGRSGNDDRDRQAASAIRARQRGQPEDPAAAALRDRERAGRRRV